MAHESFEDGEVARELNRYFVPVKVDREERPDVDGVYMRACEAMTGGGGWPTSIFMDADGKPFYAGTYFPKHVFLQLIHSVGEAWRTDRARLIAGGDAVVAVLADMCGETDPVSAEALTEKAVRRFNRTFDPEYGGFGAAPKFPSAHNLTFLLRAAPHMAGKTLLMLYRGGIFDHIGGGFMRYSTDRYWLVPHFEKMLYDNALLMLAYLHANEATEKSLYRGVAERIFAYLEAEMRAPEGGYYAAQDADSEEGEGRYYLFTPDEIHNLLGREDGEAFCRRYGITPQGNFEGRSVPNLLAAEQLTGAADVLLPKVYDYRRARPLPQTDTKLLTGWNALAAAACAAAYRILREERYLLAARRVLMFIEHNLTDETALFSGQSAGKRLGPGFLDDYAYYIFALLEMHQATVEEEYLDRALRYAERATELFFDETGGGFYFSGVHNERLLVRIKESRDAALPSGNSMMAYNLARLALLTGRPDFERRLAKQRDYMSAEAAAYPTGYGFYLYSLLPVRLVHCTLTDREDLEKIRVRSDWAFRLSSAAAYPPINGKTTYYICEDGVCWPPTNAL